MNAPHTHPRRLLLLLAALLLSPVPLPGCGEDEPLPAPSVPPRPPGAANRRVPAAAKPQATSPLGESRFQPVENWTRVAIAGNDRSPFYGFVDTRLAEIAAQQRLAAERGDQQEILQPLQRFELRQLKLIAIIGGLSNPRAEFIDPSGQRHTVTQGQLIGPGGGRVVSISENEVRVLYDVEQRLVDPDAQDPSQRYEIEQQCVDIRIAPSIAALVQKTENRADGGSIDSERRCEVIRAYPATLDEIELLTQ